MSCLVYPKFFLSASGVNITERLTTPRRLCETATVGI